MGAFSFFQPCGILILALGLHILVKELRVNNQIRIPQVQVIDHDGTQLGIMSTFDALKLAKERDLDLVEVGATAQPPIAKIMDYGKYQYQKTKEEKARPKIKQQLTKAVRVGFKTGIHDLEFKAKKADEFLAEGHIVKVELTLRGREKAFAEKGRQHLLQFLTRITVPYIIQRDPQRGPYGWVIMLQKDKKAKPPHAPTA